MGSGEGTLILKQNNTIKGFQPVYNILCEE